MAEDTTHIPGNLIPYAKRLKEIREVRRELDRVSDMLKNGPEATAEAELINQFRLIGMPKGGVVEGLGRFTTRRTSSVYMGDNETFMRSLFMRMVNAVNSGTPLADCICFHKKPTKEKFEQLIDSLIPPDTPENKLQEVEERIANQLGVQLADKVSISITEG